MKILICAMLCSVFAFAQDAELSRYKYAVVPVQFAFLKQPDQFNINTFTKMHMEHLGFEAFMDKEVITNDEAAQSCNRVYVDVSELSGFLITKLRVEIRDCRNKILFEAEGKSKQKAYNVAYREALRDAFKSFNKSFYKYKPDESAAVAPAAANVSLPTASPIAPAGSETLYAQTTAFGYQLVDNKPSVKFRLHLTVTPDVFLAESEGRTGIVSQKGGSWQFEYLQDGQLRTVPLTVKF